MRKRNSYSVEQWIEIIKEFREKALTLTYRPVRIPKTVEYGANVHPIAATAICKELHVCRYLPLAMVRAGLLCGYEVKKRTHYGVWTGVIDDYDKRLAKAAKYVIALNKNNYETHKDDPHTKTPKDEKVQRVSRKREGMEEGSMEELTEESAETPKGKASDMEVRLMFIPEELQADYDQLLEHRETFRLYNAEPTKEFKKKINDFVARASKSVKAICDGAQAKAANPLRITGAGTKILDVKELSALGIRYVSVKMRRKSEKRKKAST